MKYRYLIALAAALTGTAFAAFQAPLPEFKNEKQLAAWRAEMVAKPAAKATTEDPAFYTGKPYVASTGGYAFKYRSYNPELARWTSEDPSGFPDGANNLAYIPIPTLGYDSQGLKANRAYSPSQQTISLSVLVYAPNSEITQPWLNQWETDIEAAWSFTGIDKSNQQALKLNTNITFTLMANGTYNQSNALSQYDNVITFAIGNYRSEVENGRIGLFDKKISTDGVIHEFGHFMDAPNKYKDFVFGGVTYQQIETGWRYTIMGTCDQAKATKQDANLVLTALGETTHLFE